MSECLGHLAKLTSSYEVSIFLMQSFQEKILIRLSDLRSMVQLGRPCGNRARERAKLMEEESIDEDAREQASKVRNGYKSNCPSSYILSITEKSPLYQVKHCNQDQVYTEDNGGTQVMLSPYEIEDVRANTCSPSNCCCPNGIIHLESSQRTVIRCRNCMSTRGRAHMGYRQALSRKLH